MNHRVAGRTLGRRTNHRIAMWRNMAVSLFTHGQITTTIPKAKSFQPFAEKLISAAKKGDLASRRRVIAKLGGEKWMITGDDDQPGVVRNKYGELQKAPKIVKHLFDEIAPRYANRDGGCTRIVKLAVHRKGDGSDLCVVQLVGDESGPQVNGRSSRRRSQADKRTAFAASLRKGGGDAAATEEVATQEPPAAGADAADADAVEQVEASAPDSASEEAVGQDPAIDESVAGKDPADADAPKA